MPFQSEWTFCQRCKSLFFNGRTDKGHCPAGGVHDAQGFNFNLPHDVPGSAVAQDSWSFCDKCLCMFFNGRPDKGHCAAGGQHEAQGFNFVLPHDVPGSSTAQDSWGFCQNCLSMFFNGESDKGHCAAGGQHVAQGFNFVLPHDEDVNTSPPINTPEDPGGVPIHLFLPGPPIQAAATGNQPAIEIASDFARVPALSALHNQGGEGISTDGDVGIHARGKQLAGLFEGDVRITGKIVSDVSITGNLEVSGDIQLAGADYAEDFDIVEGKGVDPGTVMVLSDCGGIRVSDRAYDRRVVGVLSGAGGYQPAVILDRQALGTDRLPVALMGKVFCKVDATAASVVIGDLLTTSTTPGHAMKAVNPAQAFGAVIGKALRPLAGGRDLVPILVALQ